MKNTMKTIGIATVAVLALVGCGGGEDDGYFFTFEKEYPYDAPPVSEVIKNQYLSVFNKMRAEGRDCGDARGFVPPIASPLVWEDGLYRSAYEHAEDMATVGFFGFEGSGTATDWTAQVQELGRGSYNHERMANNGVKYTSMGEILTYSNKTISETAESLCSRIMNPEITRFGIASVGKYRVVDMTD